MMPDRVTSDLIYHLRSSSGVTLDWTPNEAGARAALITEGKDASLWRVCRSAGTTERIG